MQRTFIATLVGLTLTLASSRNLTRRKKWERNLFGKAYDNVEDQQRPKYGYLNLLGHREGDFFCKHYGSSYIVLKPYMRGSVTITSGDSSLSKTRGTAPHGNLPTHEDDKDKVAPQEQGDEIEQGTLAHSAHVLLNLLERRQNTYNKSTEEVIVESDTNKQTRTKQLIRTLYAMATTNLEGIKKIDPQLMPNYIELQIHGPVLLGEDVDYIVVHEKDNTEETRKWLKKLSLEFGISRVKMFIDESCVNI